MNILIADDDASTRAALKVILSARGYSLCWATDGEKAVEVFNAAHPDLVILDVMMPVLNGFEVCEIIREQDESVPVLFLSAKGEIDDRKYGLRIGADDYMAKPFDPEELLLRVHALMRRARAQQQGSATDVLPREKHVVHAGAVEIDLRRREVRVEGRRAQLTPNEFLILALLADHAGDVVTQAEITEALWGKDYVGEPTSVAVYVRHIREKIEANPSMPVILQTEWGVGYRLQVE